MPKLPEDVRKKLDSIYPSECIPGFYSHLENLLISVLEAQRKKILGAIEGIEEEGREKDHWGPCCCEVCEHADGFNSCRSKCIETIKNLE